MINKDKLIPREKQPIKPQKFYLYFLFNKNEIVYIGETNKINSRISSHKSKRKYWDSWYSAKPCKEWTHYRFIVSSSSKQVKRWEKRLIKFYSPKYNIGHNCNSLYSSKIKERKIKGKTYYYFDYVKNNSLKAKYKRTKKGIKWINYNPFTERITFRKNNWYAYNKFLPHYKTRKLCHIIDKNWKFDTKPYNIRKITI